MPTFQTISPLTGDPIAEHELMTADQVDAALARATQAYTTWGETSLADRGKVLTRIAQLHRERKSELARLVATEMGKPLAQAEGEVELSATIFDYYAQQGPTLLADEELDIAGGGRALVRTSAIGPLLGVMPWNFPLYQVARFVAPSLILGNPVLLKHARSCVQTSLALAQIAADAGAPEGLYENLVIPAGQVNDIIADDRVHGVSLTGSEEAGRAVAEQAGRHLKKVVLELGGSDPYLVLADADLETAVTAADANRFANAGQSCTSAKRIIVHTDVWDEFLAAFLERAGKWTTGDPVDPTTKMGPMASESGRREVAEQVEDAVAHGATLHLGGVVPEGPGAFYPATVLTGVTPQMRAYAEEIFGPVAVLYRVDSVSEAVELANDSRFGLGSAVFTRDLELGDQVASRLEAGMVGINGPTRSLPNMPFGGVKASGMGRELGRFGLDEFANKKLVRFL
ncbi:NAD-dependent succinate-semialdehyde dehydrogenase [Modestobacter sp. Leaf380]|uniref:NAD-dependent succinate-semialdehyde dehydrogenase n=1 Tax=Modestobacter sp. Leaf380 TaxID=1736356 RepID=UPI0006FE9816|nr:NAD-dependent succinate-semialdehyde dehydrogenase [Modestobacter sp. Leaf380]KQS65704.1 succinate-semialdehyde dehydrogenase [Modestobacter sp. Leaf380]